MSLTDDLKAGKLKTGFYYMKLFKERAVIPFLYNESTKDWDGLSDSRIEEVLAPCDYEELQRLKGVDEKCERLATNLGKYVERESKYIQLLCECQQFLDDNYSAIENWQDANSLLIKISEVR